MTQTFEWREPLRGKEKPSPKKFSSLTPFKKKKAIVNFFKNKHSFIDQNMLLKYVLTEAQDYRVTI